MTEQYKSFRVIGAEVLAVVHEALDVASGYFQKNHVPFPYLVDSEHRVYDLYGVESKLFSLGQRPALFVIDRGGVIRYAHVGTQQWQIPEIQRVLEVCRNIGCAVAR